MGHQIPVERGDQRFSVPQSAPDWTRDETSKGSAFDKHQRLDDVRTGGAAAHVQTEKSRRTDTSLTDGGRLAGRLRTAFYLSNVEVVQVTGKA